VGLRTVLDAAVKKMKYHFEVTVSHHKVGFMNTDAENMFICDILYTVKMSAFSCGACSNYRRVLRFSRW
jgi:hypothetical protein